MIRCKSISINDHFCKKRFKNYIFFQEQNISKKKVGGVTDENSTFTSNGHRAAFDYVTARKRRQSNGTGSIEQLTFVSYK